MPRNFQVMVDNWGHTPNYTKGTIIPLEEDDTTFPYDMQWAVENGVVIEVDEHGKPVEGDRPPVVVGRLPVGDEAPLDKGSSTGGAVQNPGVDSAEASAGEASGDASDEDLTPAQKAARTRAANAASTAP
jgi:hypothetical protein